MDKILLVDLAKMNKKIIYSKLQQRKQHKEKSYFHMLNGFY